MSLADLKPISWLEEMLLPTEHIKSAVVNMDGTSETLFHLPPGWNVGLKDVDDLGLTEVEAKIGPKTYRLTKEAVLSIAHAVGLPPGYVAKTPGVLIQSHLNYWASHSPDMALKVLIDKNDETILTCAKQGITMFSNVDLLMTAVEEDLEDSMIMVDPKSTHTLHQTNIRLVDTSDTQHSPWAGGIQIRNSLTGKTPLSVQGYAYHHTLDSAAILVHTDHRYNRKIQGQDLADVMQWTSDAIEDCYTSLPHEFEVLDSLTEESFADAVAQVLADVYSTYKVPLKVRQIVQDGLIDSGDYTYYGLVKAVIAAANTEGIPEHYVTTIMEIGGALAHDFSTRCNSCKRVIL